MTQLNKNSANGTDYEQSLKRVYDRGGLMINLLIDKWIPVLRKKGNEDIISPLGLLSDSDDNPVVEVSSVRPDFDGAIMQFLIGVYQVLLSPKEDEDCNELFRKKPSVDSDSLKERIDLIAPAFVLDEGDHRFMQDPGAGVKKPKDIGELLIDNISKPNLHFIKDDKIKKICPHCAVMALLTLQLNSPVGGSGHRTSIRGGGPLTTLVCMPNDKKTLWKDIVLNILSNERFPKKDETDNIAVNKDELGRIFPWLMDNMPNSENISEEESGIVSGDMHPYHVLFNLPRRIWIDFNDTESGECDLCGTKSNSLVKYYRTINHGIKYNKAMWRHPLTPYKSDDDGELSPILGEESIGYNNWIGIVYRSLDNSLKPAIVVETYPKRLRDLSDLKINFEINAFGYAIEKGKSTARVWIKTTLPTYTVDSNYVKTFQREANNLIKTADKILYFTVRNIKLSYTRHAVNEKQKENKNCSINQGKFADVSASFWHLSESLFYKETLPRLKEAIIADSMKGDDEHFEVIKCKKDWLNKLSKIVMKIFDDRTTIPVNGGADPGSAARAKRDMRYLFSDKNKTICDLLEIPCMNENIGGNGKK